LLVVHVYVVFSCLLFWLWLLVIFF